MKFQDATAAAPKDADFIAYQQSKHEWVIIHRRSDGTLVTCANTDSTGYGIFAAGVNATRRSLWSYTSRIFICGTVEQMLANTGEPA